MLYWQDSLEVIQHLYSNPIFARCMDLFLYCLVNKEDGQCVYGEFISADFTWDYQVNIFIAIYECVLMNITVEAASG